MKNNLSIAAQGSHAHAKHRLYPVILLCTLLVIATPLYAKAIPGKTTGVVEFAEKNSIGIDNAGVIVPEILVSHLKNIGKYTLSERILLKKVLKEQALQMTGMVDSETAGELGKLYGLDAIITGSIMKVGEEITVSGRVIKTESGEIIASGTIEYTDIAKTKESLEKLAYLLSGYTEDGYKKLKVSHELSRSSYGVRLGTGFAQNKNNSGSSGILLSLFYQGENFGAEFNGIPPVMANVALVNPAISFYPFTHVGFGASFIFCSDELSMDNKGTLGEVHWHGEYMSLLIGVNVRASSNLRFSLYMGPTIDTRISYEDESNNYREYSGGFLMDFPPPAITLDAEYWLPNNISLRFLFVMAAGEGELDDGSDEEGMQTLFLTLSAGYRFSL